jgi:hypothetical protein
MAEVEAVGILGREAQAEMLINAISLKCTLKIVKE